MSKSGDYVTVAVSYWPERGNPIKQSARGNMEESSYVDLHWLHPEREHPRLHHDGVQLFHLSKQRQHSMRDLEGFSSNGTKVLNGPNGLEIANDRVRSSQVMEENGIPTPNWEYGNADESDITSPAIVKDRYEHFDEGYDHTVFLESEPDFEGNKYIQEYHPESITVKSYRIPTNLDRPNVFTELLDGHQRRGGEEVIPSPEIERLVGDIHEAFPELEMFEADIILPYEEDLAEEPEYQVIDVNPFVSLRDIEDGARLYEDSLVDPINSEYSQVPED